MRKFRYPLIIVILLAIGVASSFAAVTGEQLWVKRYAGLANNASSRHIAVDNEGNAYVAGYYYTGKSVDYDFVTIKYGPSGTSKWTKTFDAGPKDSYPSGIAVDQEGNAYVAGSTYDTKTSFNFALIKYGPSGNVVWTRRYDSGIGESRDMVSALAIDPTGNIYVTGSSSNKSWGTHPVTIKYSPSGTRKWLKRYGKPGDNNYDQPVAMVVDNDGNVIVSGETTDETAFHDYLTFKYDANGNMKWVRTYQLSKLSKFSSDVVRALAVDKHGNTYVTGECDSGDTKYDLVTIKYNMTGTRKWVKRYSSPSSQIIARAIAVDQNGNSFVAIYNRGPENNVIIVKYDSAGSQKWVRAYKSPGGWAYSEALAISSKGNIYVVGSGYVGPINDFDFAVIKYDQAGNRRWVRRYNSPKGMDDAAYAIAIGKNDSVFVTGESEVSNNYDTVITTIKYQP